MDYKEYGQTIGEAITKQNVKVTNLISLLNLFESKEHLTTFLVGVYMGLGEDKRYKKNRKTDYKFDTVNIYSKESINDVTEAINVSFHSILVAICDCCILSIYKNWEFCNV